MDMLSPRMRGELYRRIMQRRVSVERSGERQLLDFEDEWIRMQRQRACMLRERAQIEIEARVRNAHRDESIMYETKRNRLFLYKNVFSYQRVKRELEEARSRVPAWAGMLKEDRVSAAYRPYLTCEAWKLNEIKAVFRQFDKDGSGLVSIDEFQNLLFELGIAVTASKSRDVFAKIDLDGSGEIDIFEFTVWWLCDAHEGKDLSEYEGNVLVRTQLEMRKRRRRFVKVAAETRRNAQHNVAAGIQNVGKRGARRASIIGTDIRKRVRAVTQVVRAAANAQREAAQENGSDRNKKKKKKKKRHPIIQKIAHFVDTPQRVIRNRKEARERKKRRERELVRRAEMREQQRKKEAEEKLKALLEADEAKAKKKAASEASAINDARVKAMERAQQRKKELKERKEAKEREEKERQEELARKKREYLAAKEAEAREKEEERIREEKRKEREDELLRSGDDEEKAAIAKKREEEEKDRQRKEEEKRQKEIEEKRRKAEEVRKNMEAKLAELKSQEEYKSAEAQKARAEAEKKERERRMKRAKRRAAKAKK